MARLIAIEAGLEVVLSLGAIQTPKVLMQSGIGDQAELQRSEFRSCSIFRVSARTFRTILVFDCVWEYREALPPRNTLAEATFFWRSDPSLDTPDIADLPG